MGARSARLRARAAGPIEEHPVEELAGVLWRKRRLRLAEAAAHRRGFKKCFREGKTT